MGNCGTPTLADITAAYVAVAPFAGGGRRG
jgi:hypothetical protein